MLLPQIFRPKHATSWQLLDKYLDTMASRKFSSKKAPQSSYEFLANFTTTQDPIGGNFLDTTLFNLRYSRDMMA